jgi:hypothetical protein
MKRRIRVAAASSLLALGVLGLVACGGDGDDDTTTEATVSPETTTEAQVPPDTTLPPKPSPEQVQELRRVANDWASLFAVRFCNRYMSGRVCVQLDCARHLGDRPIKNCTPVSAAFQESFAVATVEDIKLKGIVLVGPSLQAKKKGTLIRPVYEAAVKFSNGEVVVFDEGPGACPGPRRGRGDGLEGAPPGGGGSCPWAIAPPNRNGPFLRAATAR